MPDQTARGRWWVVTIRDQKVTIVRLTSTRAGAPAAQGWSERQFPISAIRHVDLDPPGFFRDGSLRLHLDGTEGDGDGRVERIAFKRDEMETARKIAVVLRALSSG
ncbi:DUF4429 domain-containing protein [Rothia sp. ARF10]|nr:DUF4429 domain-containing protein [Rothia sp. ARF10]